MGTSGGNNNDVDTDSNNGHPRLRQRHARRTGARPGQQSIHSQQQPRAGRFRSRAQSATPSSSPASWILAAPSSPLASPASAQSALAVLGPAAVPPICSNPRPQCGCGPCRNHLGECGRLGHDHRARRQRVAASDQSRFRPRRLSPAPARCSLRPISAISTWPRADAPRV